MLEALLSYCGFFLLFLLLHVFYPIYEYSSEWLLFWRHCCGFLMGQTDSKPSQMENTVVVPLTWGGPGPSPWTLVSHWNAAASSCPLPSINLTFCKALTILCCELCEYPDCGKWLMQLLPRKLGNLFPIFVCTPTPISSHMVPPLPLCQLLQ